MTHQEKDELYFLMEDQYYVDNFGIDSAKLMKEFGVSMKILNKELDLSVKKINQYTQIINNE